MTRAIAAIARAWPFLAAAILGFALFVLGVVADAWGMDAWGMNAWGAVPQWGSPA